MHLCICPKKPPFPHFNAWPLSRVVTNANPGQLSMRRSRHGVCLPSFAAHYGGTSRAVAPAVVIQWAVARLALDCRALTAVRKPSAAPAASLGSAGAGRSRPPLPLVPRVNRPLPPSDRGAAVGRARGKRLRKERMPHLRPAHASMRWVLASWQIERHS